MKTSEKQIDLKRVGELLRPYCKSITHGLNFKKGCVAHVVTSKNVL